MPHVIVYPDEIWDFFLENIYDMEYNTEELVAENPAFGVEIYLTSMCPEGTPSLIVLYDDEAIDIDCGNSAEECETKVSEIYERYLEKDYIYDTINDDLDFIDFEGDDNELETYDFNNDFAEWEISHREGELADAASVFISELTACEIEVTGKEILLDVVDHIGQYLYLKYGISIYYPQLVESEPGDKKIIDYPYEEMDYGEI